MAKASKAKSSSKKAAAAAAGAVEKKSSDNGTTGLLQQMILAPHWEEYQQQQQQQQQQQLRSGTKRDDVLKRTVEEVLAAMDEYALTARFESSVSLKGGAGPSSSVVEEEIAACMLHFTDCAFGAVVEATGKVNEEHTASNAILELTVAVVASASKQSVCEAVIDRLTRFSACDVEAVRVVAVTALGKFAKHLLLEQREKSLSNDGDDGDATTELLDALQQAVLPRFTDKAVAVRGAAVAAASALLTADPDVLQAVLWVLQHDQSPTNRSMAATLLPVNLQTVDYLVHRLRDVKSAVRTAALTALSAATIITSPSTHADNDDDGDASIEPLLQARHLAEIVTAGYTSDRCPATKQATRRLICSTWIKAVHYDPVALLRCVNVLENPAAAAAVVQALLEVATDPSTSLLPLSTEDDILDDDAESIIRAFQQGMSAATDFSIEELLNANDDQESYEGKASGSLPVERLFLACSVISQTASAREKDLLLSRLVPDIPVLCQVLERFATKLVQALAAADDGSVDQEEELIFICSELLQLATINAASMEEGSRRVFSAAMKSLLANILTPDDLVEGCVQALQQSAVATIDQEVISVLQQLAESATEELRVNYALRILSILTVVLETALPGPVAIREFAQHIVPAVTHANPLVREAAVSCFGKLGLFSDPDIVQNNYQATMLSVATDDAERMEIRAQAMLALADWSLLFANTDVDCTFCEQIGDMMEPRNGTGTVCVAAEIATKLLLTGKVCDSNWLARLVLIFFDESMEEDGEGNVKQVGSPVRLQQLLSVFFPALAASSKTGRDALMGSISAVLALVNDMQNKKMSRKAGPVVTKMIDFVVSTVELGRSTVAAAEQQQTKKKHESTETRQGAADGDKEPESSPKLLAIVQVATFLSEKSSDLSTTVLRALCKMIGGIDLVIDNELWEHLSLLKELLEELDNVIDDENCLRSMARVTELLADVEMEDEVDDEEEDSDQESLANAMGNIAISKGSENEGSALDKEEGSEVGSAIKGRDSTAESVDLSRRRHRRLRPSN